MNDTPLLSPPPLVARLAYLALAPFITGAALVWMVDADLHSLAAAALSAYAAVVLSFIGAIHWGLGMRDVAPDPRLFLWGVVPSIVAWLAALTDPRFGIPVQSAMLIACYLVDRSVYPKKGVGSWLPLRLRLTVGAVVCCLVGVAGL